MTADHKASHYAVFITPCYIVSLSPNIFLSTLFSNTRSVTFLPQCQWRSFTVIQNKKHNYSYEYFKYYIFGWQTDRQRILHQMIKSIPWLQSALYFKMIVILICWAVSRDGRRDTEQVETAALAK